MPDHTASMMKNRNKGGTTQAIKATHNSVSTILPGEENRLVRNQPIAPARASGGGSRSAGVVRKKG